jgi:DNA-binding MarR family transcriptional regulator
MSGLRVRSVVADLAHLFSELIRFETELWNAVDRRMRVSHELPMSWFEPMSVIERHGACRVNDIAQELAITVGGTSKLVDRIENAGHCDRVVNPDDGRSSIIQLTPAGKTVLRDATITFRLELDCRLGGSVDDRALTELTATLSTLRAAGIEIDKNDKDH